MPTGADFPADYEQELMPPDVVAQDMHPLIGSSDSILNFCIPPLEIADYLSHYFPPA
jgi:hypothetical protein